MLGGSLLIGLSEHQSCLDNLSRLRGVLGDVR
jgi:hypothetical protein